MPKLPNEADLRKRVLELRAKGRSYSQIEAELGVSRPFISSSIKAQRDGATRRDTSLDAPKREEAHDLELDEETPAEDKGGARGKTSGPRKSPPREDEARAIVQPGQRVRLVL